MEQILDKNLKRVDVLGYPVDIETYDRVLDRVESFLQTEQSCHVVTINPEIIMNALKNNELSDILKDAEIVIPDAIGIKLALAMKNINIEKIPGIEFSENLLEICNAKKYRVAFIGSSQENLNFMLKNLRQKYSELQIVFTCNGYFNENDEPKIIENLQQSKAQVIFVALGAPKQEFFIAKYKKILNSCIMLGVGGSFDIWAGKIKRAPVIFRQFELEWFYRLLSQPSRFNRMFPTLPLFLYKCIIKTMNERVRK